MPTPESYNHNGTSYQESAKLTTAVFSDINDLKKDAIYSRILEAYCFAFGDYPWNEKYTPQDVAAKMEAQLTIPDTKPIIVTLQKGEQFGFAWGLDGKPEKIVPLAVDNDFPDFDDSLREKVTNNVLSKIKKRLPQGEILWGCELGAMPSGGSLFLHLVRTEARLSDSSLLFGITKEGTKFLELMRWRGGIQEMHDKNIPEDQVYFTQDLERLVNRKK
jgi:hypothetical protein